MMTDWETAVAATRLAAALVIALFTGIILSTLLAAVGYANGYSPEPVFNLTGLGITAYMLAWLWLGGSRR